MTRSERASANDLRSLVHLARKELLRSVDADQDAAGLDRLVRARHRAIATKRRAPYVWGSAVLAAALTAFAVRPLLRQSSDHLAYTVQSTGYEFSDGTVISLRSGANLQVLSVDESTPHVRLTSGEAEVRVVHRPNSQWDFSAGPFDVAVVGTAFDLKWDVASRTFSLDLRQGAVRVTGPVLDGPLLLRAGHRVSITLDPGRVAIDMGKAAPSASESAATPRAAPSTANVPSAQPSPGLVVPSDVVAPRVSPKLSWRALVGRGRFAEVIEQAQAMPIEGCLSQCAATDLRALGDAARYTGRAALAERAFLGLRERFLGSPDSVVAAFLLAHTYEAQHRPVLAATWYERYLSEAPSGQFATEARTGRARVADQH
jgi:FecR protein